MKDQIMGSLSGIFNKVVIGGALMLAGDFLLEPFILPLFHNNAGGLALVSAINPFLQSIYDFTGLTWGLEALAGWINPSIGEVAQAIDHSTPGNYFGS